MNKTSFKKGFSFPEILVYIAIMTTILLIVVNIVFFVSKSIRQSSSYNNIRNSAVFGLEKIKKEVMSSYGIDLNQSVFDSSNGVLVLNSKDENDISKTIKFYLDDGLVKMDIDGDFASTVTYSDTRVLKLFFVPIDTVNSKGVKIEMGISGEGTNFLVAEDFYSTVVLRNSY
ncbi:MAG: type II secretion system protein [Candidatus Paceibacterota bacterium]|jgi:hypothetical protein